MNAPLWCVEQSVEQNHGAVRCGQRESGSGYHTRTQYLALCNNLHYATKRYATGDWLYLSRQVVQGEQPTTNTQHSHAYRDQFEPIHTLDPIH